MPLLRVFFKHSASLSPIFILLLSLLLSFFFFLLLLEFLRTSDMTRKSKVSFSCTITNATALERSRQGIEPLRCNYSSWKRLLVVNTATVTSAVSTPSL